MSSVPSPSASPFVGTLTSEKDAYHLYIVSPSIRIDCWPSSENVFLVEMLPPPGLSVFSKWKHFSDP